MRPTDEDQPGSRRPNLMASSRRGAGDINILAMLDGLGTRPHAKRHMLWYGAGGLLVCGLIGALAWMVHEPAAQLDSTMVQVEGSLPPAPAPVPASPASAPPERIVEAFPGSVDSAPEAPPAPIGGAAIVDVAGSSEPVERIHSIVMPKPVPALRAPAPKNPASHLPARAVAATHPSVAHPGPKRSAPAARPAPAPAAVDTDVALISAIIQHAAKQREAVENNGCTDKPCGPRMPTQP